MRWRVIWSLPAIPLAGIGFAATGPKWAAIAVVYLAAVTAWLVRYDIREHRLPNFLVLPGIAAALVACAGEWLVGGRIPAVPLIAGVAYTAVLLALNLIGGLGMGDVKLGAALGLSSWSLPIAVLSPVVAFLIGGVVAAVLLARGHRGRRIAFGPYLLGGYWAAASMQALLSAWHDNR